MLVYPHDKSYGTEALVTKFGAHEDLEAPCITDYEVEVKRSKVKFAAELESCRRRVALSKWSVLV